MSSSVSPSASPSKSPSASSSVSPEMAAAEGYFYYMRYDEMVTPFASVSGGPTQTGGDSPYQPGWLCDVRPNRPVRALTSSPQWGVACLAAGPVNLLVAANTNLDDGQIVSVTGDVSGYITVNRQKDGKCRNGWQLVSLVPSVQDMTVSVVGNSQNVVFGEFLAGFARQLRRGTIPGGNQTKEYRRVRPDHWSSVRGYKVGQHRWWKTYDVKVDLAEFEAIRDWEEASDDGYFPSVIIPDIRINDCFVVDFRGFTFMKQGPQEYDCTLHFLEHARTKWSVT